MTYVIGMACVDVTDKSFAGVPSGLHLRTGQAPLYINPDECVDCGARKLICRVGAIEYETDLPEDEQQHLADNAASFTDVLPGRDAPLGSPGGAAKLGPVGVDTGHAIGRRLATPQSASALHGAPTTL